MATSMNGRFYEFQNIRTITAVKYIKGKCGPLVWACGKNIVRIFGFLVFIYSAFEFQPSHPALYFYTTNIVLLRIISWVNL